jgi:hypothetical protein
MTEPPPYLRAYLLVLGAVLLGQGTLSLVLHAGFGVDLSPTHGFLTTDERHAGLHVVWGLVLLVAIALRVQDRTLLHLGLFFGLFFLTLTFLGIFIHYPFGLRLGWGENAFHAIIGPLALTLTALQARRAHQRPLAPGVVSDA